MPNSGCSMACQARNSANLAATSPLSRRTAGGAAFSNASISRTVASPALIECRSANALAAPIPAGATTRIGIDERERLRLVEMGAEGGIARVDLQRIRFLHLLAGAVDKAEKQLLRLIVGQRHIAPPVGGGEDLHLVLFDADQPGISKADTSMPTAWPSSFASLNRNSAAPSVSQHSNANWPSGSTPCSPAGGQLADAPVGDRVGRDVDRGGRPRSARRYLYAPLERDEHAPSPGRTLPTSWSTGFSPSFPAAPPFLGHAADPRLHAGVEITDAGILGAHARDEDDGRLGGVLLGLV